MRWVLCAVSVLGLGLACGGGAAAPSGSVAATTKGAPKLSKPLTAEQAKTAKGVATAKAKNGKASPDGSKKLQVERKKKKAPSGEIVWVIVEEWVPVDEWHDEIWVVDAFVEGDDVLLVELDDFDAALIDELVELEVAELEQVLIEEVAGAIVEEAVNQAVEEAVEEAIVEEIVNGDEEG